MSTSFGGVGAGFAAAVVAAAAGLVALRLIDPGAASIARTRR